MKYYSITVSKIDWNNATNCTKLIACICSENVKDKYFLEEIKTTKMIYPEIKNSISNKNEYSYVDKENIIHRIECEEVIIFND